MAVGECIYCDLKQGKYFVNNEKVCSQCPSAEADGILDTLRELSREVNVLGRSIDECRSKLDRLLGADDPKGGSSSIPRHNIVYVTKANVHEIFLKKVKQDDGHISTTFILWQFLKGRLAVVVLGLFALAIGIILSSIPWLDYLVLKNLRLWNDTLSFHYWQRPGVLRLTKVFIFNVTNPDGFLNAGEKPNLEEIGPFVYREDMEKINIRFFDNGTVRYQHKKILVFVPELSLPKDLPITVPNIPLLTFTSQAKHFSGVAKLGISLFLSGFAKMRPFKTITAEEMVFGYDDTLTKIANTYYPRGKRPPEKMGLLLGRNGTLDEVHTMFTGHAGMENFGLLNRLNGLDHLPYWSEEPCNSIRASEGSLFPPRDLTHSDIVHVYDKDLCRILPLRYRHNVLKEGITAGYYSPDDDIFENGEKKLDNKCYCPDECPPKGLQNISPCQYDAPVYLSFPHFYQADKELLDSVTGLKPDKEKHETYFKIQPKLGVTIEAKVRVQLNLKVEQSDVHVARRFRSIVFPVMWLEEGVGELSPAIHRWVYLSTTVADIIAPVLTYGLIATGTLILVSVFVQAYKNIVFTRENIERSKQKFRRGSSYIVNGQHRLMIVRDSYTLLSNTTTETAIDSEL